MTSSNDQASNSSRPNVVFMVGDNVGWGDIGCYGGTAPTPRIDALAAEGQRLKNYNVEAQCTPTRSAILSGRLPIRTGNCSVPLPWPMVFDLINDPIEQWDLIDQRLDCAWVFRPVAMKLGALAQSAAKYPHVKPGEDTAGHELDAIGFGRTHPDLVPERLAADQP